MFNFSPDTSKEEVFQKVNEFVIGKGFEIKEVDIKRPWGGFFVITESSLPKFIEAYFADQEIDLSNPKIKLQPKFLVVAPHVRLSWQYHHRRSELWRVVYGPVGAILSNTDKQTEIITYEEGSLIDVATEQRHRLVGLDSWGIVAEMWKHVDIKNVSTEVDIVRISDDFGR